MGGRTTDVIMLIAALSEEDANTTGFFPRNSKGSLGVCLYQPCNQTTAARDPGVPNRQRGRINLL